MLRLDSAAFLRGLRLLEGSLMRAAGQALFQAATDAAEMARQTTAFKDRTGKLRASIALRERTQWSLSVRAGGQGARHGLIVEEGSKAHVIEARRAKALRFVVAGGVRFARRVNHPGTQPTHFMLHARDQAETQLARFIEIGFAQAIR